MNPPPGGEMQELREQVERLLLVTEALWRIVREKTDCEEKDLLRQISQIDLEDGTLDGRKTVQPPRPCPKCGRVTVKHRIRCLYCQELILVDPFER